MDIKLNFEQRQVSHSISSADISISEFKTGISTLLDIPKDQIRLVSSSGRVLSVDEAQLSEFDIKDGDIIYVTRKPSNTTGTAQPILNNTKAPGHPAIPAGMSEMMQNPLVQFVLINQRSLLSNPEFMSHMLNSDPRVKRMMEQNPEIRQMVSSQSFLKQMSDMMKNPNMMQEMLRNQDRQLSNIEAIPGGFNYLSSMYSSLMEPIDEPSSTSTATQETQEKRELNTEALPNPWAQEPAQTPTQIPTQPTTSPFPFPFASPLQQPFASPFPFQLPMMQQHTTTTSGIDNETKYASQLEQLKEMGFSDKSQCIRALLAAGGDVEAAIQYILENFY